MESISSATESHSRATRPTHTSNCMQPCWNKFTVAHNHKMCMQMYFGFTCTFITGLVLLSVGCVFINVSIVSKNSINIMLCILGVVCGLILIATSALLGRIFISRKCVQSTQSPTQQPHHPESVCFQFHQCSVVHTLSHDQLNSQSGCAIEMDAPPSYESATGPQFSQTAILHGTQPPHSHPVIEVHSPTSIHDIINNVITTQSVSQTQPQNHSYQPLHVMPQPPLYMDSIAPLPQYSDNT